LTSHKLLSNPRPHLSLDRTLVGAPPNLYAYTQSELILLLDISKVLS